MDALIKAKKDFDLLIVRKANPGGFMPTPYFERRRWDYFVRHLMGETPPAYRIVDVPVDPDSMGV